MAVHRIRADPLLRRKFLKILIARQEAQEEANQLTLKYLEEICCRVPRTYWVKPWLKRRSEQGHYSNLMKELAEEDPQLYKNFLRLDEALFDEIVERLRPRIEKDLTFFREPISTELRVAITLRFLATGNSYKSLSYSFRVAPNTISKIVPETCEAIVAEFGEDVIRFPSTVAEWKEVAAGFSDRWHFHHTLGAIDGKHVRIRCPDFGGSKYYNYKKYHSILLVAIVDADYKFLHVDVGSLGSASDAGVFAYSTVRELLDTNSANVPELEPLPGAPSTSVPYFLIGDDAFPLRTWMQKPYAQRNMTRDERLFNYRLSRARRVVENAFGIVANRYVGV